MMFYYELQDDERQVVEQQKETPFTFCLSEGQYADEADASRRLQEEVEDAAAWLALRGVGGVRADGSRGRLWTDREESGKAFIFLLDRYKVRRESGHNLVELA
jgi:hypothetical protein